MYGIEWHKGARLVKKPELGLFPPIHSCARPSGCGPVRSGRRHLSAVQCRQGKGKGKEQDDVGIRGCRLSTYRIAGSPVKEFVYLVPPARISPTARCLQTDSRVARAFSFFLLVCSSASFGWSVDRVWWEALDLFRW